MLTRSCGNKAGMVGTGTWKGPEAFRIGPWRVDPQRNLVEGRECTRTLERKSMALLVLLAQRAPETVTRDEIIETIWGGRVVTDDAINKQVSKLRAALAGTADPLIETVPKVGIRLTVVAEPIAESRRRSKRIILALAGGALASAAVIALWSAREPPDWDLVQEPVTSVPGSEIEPALSPDGKMLAYVARAHPDAPFALYVRAAGSDEGRRITANGVSARAPAWSDDGRIAFISRSGKTCRISIALPTGSAGDIASCVLAEAGGIAWINDRKLVVSDHPANGTSFRLTMLDIATGQRQLLVDPPIGDVGDLRPVMSADRKIVYFLRNRSVGPSEIYSAEIGSRRATAISADGAAINGLALGPSGTLLVSSERSGTSFALWSLKPQTREWKRLSPEAARNIASTPNGSVAVYSRFDRQVSLWQQPFDGAQGRPIAPSTRVDWSPALSSDGRRLAFLSNRSGSSEIWVVDLGSGAVKRLTAFAGSEVQDLDWSLNDRLIATAVARHGLFDVHLIDPESGRGQTIAATNLDERQPFFTPDGRSLWFIRRDRTRFQLRSIDLVSKREVVLLEDAIRALPAAGGTAYISKPFGDGLWRADLAQRSIAKIAPWPDSGRNRNVTMRFGSVWTTAPDESGFALMKLEPGSRGFRRIVSLPQLARPSGIAVTSNSVIYARLRREEADLVTLRFERRR